ncbi:putative glycosyl hydrolase [Desulfosporosinus acidiphilus SJ4]|uniref:Putative glycosyl hydrolase n=1 Tax=Desulfosporosinus acidiphilus (strain DSM 22704 / JCM 16185 / SJ4) TaxID=646529 RepID=I4D8F6_DESAJ|nr:glycosyl hydrolase family 18 protein [Desulfosporosinus acidiphilus]AFM42080.1 putative glycosyl hydrolase [Desulfosporosinus acidiphilus SJ4]
MNWTPTVRHLMDNRLWVLGYVSDDYPGDLRGIDSIRQQGSHIDVYADFAFQLQTNGFFTGQINNLALQEGLARNIAPLILFHNFNGRIFDPIPIRTVLASTSSQKNCIQQMINLLPPSAAGVHVDFEGVEAPYRIPFIAFLESLRAVLHDRGLLLTIAVPAKRSEWEAPGYDFTEIGRLCDAITLMTYDEHFSGGSPGPIASLPWMTQTLDYAIRYLPQDKLLLGIPVYGYDWSNEATQIVPMRDIPGLAAKANARILWSDTAVEPYFYYWLSRSRHSVWFENEISTKIRLGFVKSYRLRGIAIWRLGYETNRFWQGVTSKLKK